MKDFVAPLCVHSAGDGWGVQADEGHGGEDESGAGGHHQKVGVMRAGVTGEEVRDIVRREVVNALDGRNVSMTPQTDVKNITVQPNIQSLIQAGRQSDAFQTALSSNDLALVVFICELYTSLTVDSLPALDSS